MDFSKREPDVAAPEDFVAPLSPGWRTWQEGKVCVIWGAQGDAENLLRFNI